MLRQLVGLALVDRAFCDDLMNGKRLALLAEFDLTDEEREIVASFETGSVRELAITVHNWLKKQDSPASPHVDCSTTQVL